MLGGFETSALDIESHPQAVHHSIGIVLLSMNSL